MKYLYFGGCVAKGLNLLECIVFGYKNIRMSSRSKDMLGPGLRLIRIIRI